MNEKKDDEIKKKRKMKKRKIFWRLRQECHRHVHLI